jgi:hypothetical protein
LNLSIRRILESSGDDGDQTQSKNIGDKAKKVGMKPKKIDSQKAKKADQGQTRSCQPTSKRYTKYCQTQITNKFITKSEIVYNLLPL